MLEDNVSHQPLSVPIRVEIDTETHRIRDCFIWNVRGELIAALYLFCH